MKIAFDLISDLHAETWPNFDWSGAATSPFCLVAGDIARDHDVVSDVLSELSQRYLEVLYIDGNDEHRLRYDDIAESIENLSAICNQFDNVTYLHDKVPVLNGVAFIGVNGWWTFDTCPTIDFEDAQAACADYLERDAEVCQRILNHAISDAAYAQTCVSRLQTHIDVTDIVMVCHTVPNIDLIEHDLDLKDTWRMACSGNSLLRQSVLDADTEHKITKWCFGHYHPEINWSLDGVRYINNCRGKNGTKWCRTPYYPRRIEIN